MFPCLYFYMLHILSFGVPLSLIDSCFFLFFFLSLDFLFYTFICSIFLVLEFLSFLFIPVPFYFLSLSMFPCLYFYMLHILSFGVPIFLIYSCSFLFFYLSLCFYTFICSIFLLRVINEEVLHRVKEERNIVHTIKRRKANWIGHILCRNCLLKHVIEGKLQDRI
jgi:hypothetical protein